MDTFNPDVKCLVHDKLNNELIIWRPSGQSVIESTPNPTTHRALSRGTGCCSTDGQRRDRALVTRFRLLPTFFTAFFTAAADLRAFFAV
jgi:hypothetical protein